MGVILTMVDCYVVWLYVKSLWERIEKNLSYLHISTPNVASLKKCFILHTYLWVATWAKALSLSLGLRYIKVDVENNLQLAGDG